VRLIEIRLLEGPNLYRLEPVVKIEVATGRRRTWYGRRDPEPHALVRLAATVPAGEQPTKVGMLADWVRRLRREFPDGSVGSVTVHRSSDPGYFIVVFPWALDDRARAIAEGALALASREVPPGAGIGLGRGRARLRDRVVARAGEAQGSPPGYIRDADRRLPIVSISGTNGKTTTTRLVAHILREAGHRIGATTSDGIVVGKEIVEPGDWTGFGGGHAILKRDDVDIAVLETARGGILLRGLGYESNDASVITNVSPDHLDLQGIHTLPELAEVKSVIAQVTKPGGWVILNADDHYVAQIARRVRAKIAYFSLEGDRSPRIRRHLRGGAGARGGKGGRAYLVRDGRLGEAEGSMWRPIAALADVPVVLGGIARHNVANALAAAAAARAMGATLAQVRAGLHSFLPTTEDSRGRLNVFRDATRIVIVDFAHNEAGVAMLLDVAEAIAKGVGGVPVTGIVGLAGDRPDDTLRGVGKIVAQRVDRFVQKEMLHYLRGRTRESVLGEIRQGARDGGWEGEIPVYGSEVEAVAAELDRTDPAAAPKPASTADGITDVIFLLCHEQREEIYKLLEERRLQPVDDPKELARLVSSP
jgi:cyanophycin synthetase